MPPLTATAPDDTAPLHPGGDPPGPDDFASALRRAVEKSGLGLENIQRRLVDRDVPVSVATLSYWQNGNRVPGRKRSEVVVAHLESVLGLEPRSLRRLIPAPRPRGRAVPQPAPLLVPKMTVDAAVRRIAERVQTRHDGHLLTRISQHDVVVIGADRRISSLRTRTVARAEADEVRGMGITQFFEDRTAGSPWLTVHSGAVVTARHCDPAHRVLGSELRFTHELRRGDTVVLDVEVTADGRGPRDTSYDFNCGQQVREYVVEVRFPPGDLPTWCEKYHLPCADSGDEVRHRVRVDELGHAHAVVVDCPPGTTGLAWSWEEPPTGPDGSPVKS